MSDNNSDSESVDSLVERWSTSSASLMADKNRPKESLLTATHRKQILHKLIQSKKDDLSTSTEVGAECGSLLGQALASVNACEHYVLLELNAFTIAWLSHNDKSFLPAGQSEQPASELRAKNCQTHLQYTLVNNLCHRCIAVASKLRVRQDRSCEQQANATAVDNDKALRHNIRSPLQAALLTTEMLILECAENKINEELVAIKQSIKDAIAELNRNRH